MDPTKRIYRKGRWKMNPASEDSVSTRLDEESSEAVIGAWFSNERQSDHF